MCPNAYLSNKIVFVKTQDAANDWQTTLTLRGSVESKVCTLNTCMETWRNRVLNAIDPGRDRREITPRYTLGISAAKSSPATRGVVKLNSLKSILSGEL